MRSCSCSDATQCFDVFLGGISREVLSGVHDREIRVLLNAIEELLNAGLDYEAYGLCKSTYSHLFFIPPQLLSSNLEKSGFGELGRATSLLQKKLRELKHDDLLCIHDLLTTVYTSVTL